MNTHKHDIILIPAYEPEPILELLVKEAQNAGFAVVVVNDGSGAFYAPVFRRIGEYAHVLTHEKNLGKGAALKTGFRFIKEKYGNTCIVITMDADGQHKLEDAVRIGHMAKLHPEALILGCRSRLSGEAPLRSRFGNAVTRIVYRIVTGCQIYDTQTGLRAFDGTWLAPLLTIEGERYEYEMNVLLSFARHNRPIIETEIATIYEEGNQTSHFHTLRDSYRIYKEILKFSLSSLIGFVVDYSMYAALLAVTGFAGMASSSGLILSNVGSRIVSASVNYMINRKIVFQSQNNAVTSAFQYFLLALFLLCCNTIVLNVLVNGMGANRYVAKVLVELFFFLFSWIIQRRFVFRERKEQVLG